jgi:hypothetical protein
MPVSQINNNSLATGVPGRANMPSGSVIQTVNTYVANSPDIATTSGSLVTSGITASITPTDASNLICIEFSASMSDPQSGGLASIMYVNGSAMPGADSYHVAYRDNSVRYAPSTFRGTFQPSNTSTLTFAVFFRSLTPGTSARLVHALSSYGLKLTEIKA